MRGRLQGVSRGIVTMNGIILTAAIITMETIDHYRRNVVMSAIFSQALYASLIKSPA